MLKNLFKKSLDGIHVKHNKNTMNSDIVSMPVPDKVNILMQQHMGAPCKPIVKVNDVVCVGTKIGDTEAFMSAPIYSSVSGTVTAINEVVTVMGAKCEAIEITTDKLQTIDSGIIKPTLNSFDDFIKGLKNSGAVGLGGAGFPSFIKANPKNLDDVNILLINGAECEPFITSDYRAMIEHSDDIIEGINLVKKYMNIKTVYIGIENNKPDAIKHLKEVACNDESIIIYPISDRYPQGGEKVLIYSITGKVVGEGMLPSDVGVVVFNVSTISFINRYFKTGMPLVQKTITVDGDCVNEPKNVSCAIGTSCLDLLEFCGGFKKEVKKIVMGGPMMGITVANINAPIVKNNNAILAFSDDYLHIHEPTPCIRCGRCAKVCPFNLLPRELEKATLESDIDTLKKLSIMTCMECGCCTYVCPAKRQLVMSHKIGKGILRKQK